MPSNPTDFSTESIPDLTKKVFIVTGGNTGVGYETCLELVRAGASVFMAARSEERASAAIRDIIQDTGKSTIEFLLLDLQDLKQVRSAGQAFVKKGLALDCLINNAGIMACPFALSKDGIESQFATNHVGHYLFTRELMPAILKASHPRIVNLSSSYHNTGPDEGIMFDKINDPTAMDIWKRYGQTKLANMLFSRALHKRFFDKNVLVNSVHPGFVDTELTRGPVESYGWIFSPLIKLSKMIWALTPQQGALTTLYVATSPDIETKRVSNKYFVPIALEASPTIALATDDELSEKLWDFTEKLVNEKLLA